MYQVIRKQQITIPHILAVTGSAFLLHKLNFHLNAI